MLLDIATHRDCTPLEGIDQILGLPAELVQATWSGLETHMQTALKMTTHLYQSFAQQFSNFKIAESPPMQCS